VTLESLVPSRETCERLKAAGFPQDTIFHWCEQQECFGVMQFRLRDAASDVTRGPAAPLLGELLEELEKQTPAAHVAVISSVVARCRFRSVTLSPVQEDDYSLQDTNPAEAAAQVFLARAKEVRT